MRAIWRTRESGVSRLAVDVAIDVAKVLAAFGVLRPTSVVPLSSGLVLLWTLEAVRVADDGRVSVGSRRSSCVAVMDEPAADEPATSSCPCRACLTAAADTTGLSRMILCQRCGNKRCPHAADHRHGCSGSNATGQPGSAYQ